MLFHLYDKCQKSKHHKHQIFYEVFQFIAFQPMSSFKADKHQLIEQCDAVTHMAPQLSQGRGNTTSSLGYGRAADDRPLQPDSCLFSTAELLNAQHTIAPSQHSLHISISSTDYWLLPYHTSTPSQHSLHISISSTDYWLLPYLAYT